MLDAVEEGLYAELARRVIADPPYEMRWLKVQGRDQVRVIGLYSAMRCGCSGALQLACLQH